MCCTALFSFDGNHTKQNSCVWKTPIAGVPKELSVSITPPRGRKLIEIFLKVDDSKTNASQKRS